MYWNKAVESFPKEENLAFWLQNGFYYLENEDKNILLTKDAWCNNRIMDADQKLIFKVLGKTDSFQSVLNPQKISSNSFRAVNNELIQLLHDVKNHWLLSFLFQWPRSDMRWPEKPCWPVYTKELKCTLSKFKRYVERKTATVISACLKTSHCHCTCRRDSRWKISHWCTIWCTSNENASNFMLNGKRSATFSKNKAR